MASERAKATVLVAEDKAEIRDFTARVLELEGYNVLQAVSGEECLSVAREADVSLILLDLKMGGIDGWEVLASLQADAQLAGILVIVFTASASPASRERALKLGAVDYVIKPLSATRLKECIARAFGLEGRGDDAQQRVRIGG